MEPQEVGLEGEPVDEAEEPLEGFEHEVPGP
jgi:hypothetical protein